MKQQIQHNKMLEKYKIVHNRPAEKVYQTRTCSGVVPSGRPSDPQRVCDHLRGEGLVRCNGAAGYQRALSRRLRGCGDENTLSG
jgi:hypothetical protein